MNKIFSDTKIFPLPGTLGILGDTEINGLFPASLLTQTRSRKRNYWPIRGLHTTTSANKVRCWMNGSLRSIHSGILKSVPKFVTFRIIINEIFNDCFSVCQLLSDDCPRSKLLCLCRNLSVTPLNGFPGHLTTPISLHDRWTSAHPPHAFKLMTWSVWSEKDT